jgi:hypothetical protein
MLEGGKECCKECWWNDGGCGGEDEWEGVCEAKKARDTLRLSWHETREREREAAQRTDKGSCSLPVVTLTMMWACGRGAVAVVSIVMEEEEERCRCVGVVCGMPLM